MTVFVKRIDGKECYLIDKKYLDRWLRILNEHQNAHNCFYNIRTKQCVNNNEKIWIVVG